jgi:hypothetical protein
MLKVQELYPREEWQGDREFWTIGDYQPILNSIGEIVIQVDDNDYQGDSRVLYKAGEAYGWLQFGWGSCSGCDWLQGCSSWEGVQELADSLENDVQWFGSAFDALAFFREHDWEGDYSWNAAEQHEFVKRCIDYLLKAVEG